MHWLYLLGSLLCFALTLKASLPTWVVLLLLLLALGLMVAWMLGWMASRMAGVARNEVHIVTPEELRRLREQAEARKAAQSDTAQEP